MTERGLGLADSRGCARSHHVLPGVVGSGRLGGGSLHPKGDASEVRGSMTAVDLHVRGKTNYYGVRLTK